MAHATRPVSRYAAWLADGLESAANRAVSNPASLGVGADLIGLGGGQPATESYPLRELERAYSRAILEHGPEVLPYGSTQGLPAIREIVAERLARRGIHIGPESVVMLTGSIQGLHLVGRVTLDHGDTIVTEAPTFMGALAAWEHQQPRFLTIPVDDHGMRMDALEQGLAETDQHPRFMYLLPTFQNPMGVSMTLDRRREVLEIASKHNLLIIEDDPYGEFWFDEKSGSIPPIRSLPGAEERVVYLGTFSKILAPGFRLAYAVAPPGMVEPLLRAKRGIDFHSDGLLQQAIVRLIRDPDFDLEAHIAAGRGLYKQRRDAMLDALETTLSGSTWTRPGGGFFLWIDMPEHLSGDAVAATAQAEGVAVLPGSLFYPNGDGGFNGLRLSFSNAAPDRIREGIRRLQRAIATVAG
ncbi:MAG TPA: PLP-dependent aminotransferase family protein [Chloroflexota bacterium]|nr:PLP-dependent aminotransferase family protein [Chloroflexota bacterium]